jgi:hypothetical protein
MKRENLVDCLPSGGEEIGIGASVSTISRTQSGRRMEVDGVLAMVAGAAFP